MTHARKSLIATVLLLLVIICPTSRSQDKAEIKMAFENAYSAWVSYLSTNMSAETLLRSYIPSRVFYDNEPFQKIVSLGTSALPVLFEKAAEDRRLIEAIQRITKWQYHVDRTGATPQTYAWHVREFPGLKGRHGPPDRLDAWRYWWKEGRFKTSERLADLRQKRSEEKRRGQSKEAAATLQEIMDLGIAALPYLTAHSDAEPDFIPVISKLTNGELPPTATPDECKEWWKESKAKWILPGAEK